MKTYRIESQRFQNADREMVEFAQVKEEGPTGEIEIQNNFQIVGTKEALKAALGGDYGTHDLVQIKLIEFEQV